MFIEFLLAATDHFISVLFFPAADLIAKLVCLSSTPLEKAFHMRLPAAHGGLGTRQTDTEMRKLRDRNRLFQSLDRCFPIW